MRRVVSGIAARLWTRIVHDCHFRKDGYDVKGSRSGVLSLAAPGKSFLEAAFSRGAATCCRTALLETLGNRWLRGETILGGLRQGGIEAPTGIGCFISMIQPISVVAVHSLWLLLARAETLCCLSLPGTLLLLLPTVLILLRQLPLELILLLAELLLLSPLIFTEAFILLSILLPLLLLRLVVSMRTSLSLAVLSLLVLILVLLLSLLVDLLVHASLILLLLLLLLGALLVLLCTLLSRILLLLLLLLLLIVILCQQPWDDA